jgi:hypothetical protein
LERPQREAEALGEVFLRGLDAANIGLKSRRDLGGERAGGREQDAVSVERDREMRVESVLVPCHEVLDAPVKCGFDDRVILRIATAIRDAGDRDERLTGD